METAKPHKAIRVPVNPVEDQNARETAKRFGYRQVAPFVRRLLDAARRSDPSTGVILFGVGSDHSRAA